MDFERKVQSLIDMIGVIWWIWGILLYCSVGNGKLGILEI